MQDFYVASAGKSWLTVVNSSSHTEFLDAGGFLNRVIAGLCGKSGRNSFQVIPASKIVLEWAAVSTSHRGAVQRLWVSLQFGACSYNL